MTIIGIALEGAWRVLVGGLAFGAGVPILFALGVRSWAAGVGEVEGRRPHPGARVLAVVLFAVVIGAVVLGIALIVAGGFGKAISFEHLIPTVVEKS
ncbi:MAG TPA: hypothetical protein VES95_02465 [Dermatophilaceae bacterium]|nr:hypothetical protein [Dermatophilaceae bacterium]